MYQQLSDSERLNASKMISSTVHLEQHQSCLNYSAATSGSMLPNHHLSHDASYAIYERGMSNISNSSHQNFRGLVSGNAENSSSLFVLIPRVEYDFVRQEIVDLKYSITEMTNRIKCELEQLKSDSQMLRQKIGSCHCAAKYPVSDVRKSAGRGLDSQSESMQEYTNNTQSSSSSPDRTDVITTDIKIQTGGKLSNGAQNLSECATLSASDNTKLVQLLPDFDVWVNHLSIQIIVNEAPTRKHGAALFVLRRIIPLVFSWDELACSRGQGLHCKTADEGCGKVPLDPMKVAACKAFMRKFCSEIGCVEPSKRTINQTFSHQVNYARRRLKTSNSQVQSSKQTKQTAAIDSVDHVTADDENFSTQLYGNVSIKSETEQYIQM